MLTPVAQTGDYTLNLPRPKPVVLIILDGFGYNASDEYNAIAAANTPTWDALWNSCQRTLLHCAGETVGLPDDQMGNSEVGHLHLGAGRLINQDFTAVNKAIRNGSFYENPALVAAAVKARDHGKALHIFGLLSPGGVHSHDHQIQAMAELAVRQGVKNVYMHAFLDGRDTPPQSAAGSIKALEAKFAELGSGRIATITGRFYAMDRDNRWDRVEKAYRLIVEGEAEFTAATAIEGLEQAYARGETDEFVQPTAIVAAGESPVHLEDGDSVVFMNFRADRAREITKAINDADFDGFPRKAVRQLGAYVTLTEYHQDFTYPVAFPPVSITETLGEVLAEKGLTQLRLAETEKYAHVTFFFNGGRDDPFPGESRILIPSPKVKTYDMQPEMSALEVTDELVKAIEGQTYDVIICNYANGDMVGHTGIMDAAVKAVETLDASLKRVVAALDKVGGELLVTADHGNVEQMVDPETGVALTQHTTFPVPLVFKGRAGLKLDEGGNLADIAPTILHLLGIQQPAVMTGRSLLH
jgi:2,3-bisphosphoglycerate-independent phosphoglycerate mutase